MKQIITYIVFFLAINLFAEEKNTLPKDAEDGIYSIQLGKLTGTMNVILYNQKVYLPLNDFLSSLKIFYTSTDNRTFKGFYIENDSLFNLDFNKKEATISNRTFILKDNDFLFSDVEVYVQPEILDTIFQLRTTLNNQRLTIKIETDLNLPILAEADRMKAYSKIKNNKNDDADLKFAKDFHVLNGGILEYSLNSRAYSSIDISHNYQTRLGLELLGGDFQINTSGNYYQKQHLNSYTNYYTQKYYFNSNYITFIQLGDVYPIAQYQNQYQSPLITDKMTRGIYITNSKYRNFDNLYRNLVLADSLGQGWQTELYVNNKLYAHANTDNNGRYNFALPIEYGNTEIEQKFYGPKGEYYNKMDNYNVTQEFLPPGTVNYSISGGKNIYTDKYLMDGQFTVGLTSWLTNTVRYQRDYAYQDYTLLDQTTIKLGDLFVLNGAYIYDKIFSGSMLLNINKYSGIYLAYTKYSESSDLNYSGATQSFNLGANISNIFGLPVSLYARCARNYIATSFTDQISTSLNTNLLGMNFSFRYSGNLYSANSANTTPNQNVTMTMMYFIPNTIQSLKFLGGSYINTSGYYDIITHQLSDINLAFSYPVFSVFNLSFNYDRNFLLSSNKFGLSVNFNTQYFNANSNAQVDKTSENSFSQSISGTMGFEPRGFKAIFNRSNAIGIGSAGAIIRFFLDKNMNGIYDGDDILIPGVKAQMTGKFCSMNVTDNDIILNSLTPFEKYSVKIDVSSFQNPFWMPKYEEFAFETEPNSYKRIDIPCYSSGSIEGTVNKYDGITESGQDRVKIHIVSKDGNYHETLPVFNDGSFYKIKIPSGEYSIYVDSLQVKLLEAVCEPPVYNIQIKVTDDQQEFSDINFKLNLTKQIEINKYKSIESKPIASNPINKNTISANNTDSSKAKENTITKKEKKVKDNKPQIPDDGVICTLNFTDPTVTYINPSLQKELDKVAKFLNEYPNSNIIIEGHTDKFGTDEDCKSVSEKRATNARAYLIQKKNIAKERIVAVGKGFQKSLVDNDTEANRKKNGRIIVKIFK